MKIENFQLSLNDKISVPIPESYKDTITLIKSDLYRLTGKEASLSRILFRLIFRPFSNTLVWLRLSSYKGIIWPICRLMYAICQKIHNIDIPPTTKIGFGFYIGHGMCIVINSGTIIGNNVNVSQFLNIGTNHNTPAIIGDNVYIGPTVCIVENVKIGSNSTIGAGAVVTKDIPLNSTSAGCPTKVLNYEHPPDFITEIWLEFQVGVNQQDTNMLV